jgi:hypothetical protein
MSPHTFATSPAARGEQRKYTNITPGFVGVNVFAPDGKPTSIAVEPHGEVWLTPEEERMTAEAPRRAEDNPFVKQWEEPVERDSFGEVTATATREGVLVPSDEPPRPIASDRFIPPRANGHTETVTGAPPIPRQPPVQGQRSPGEVVGTPQAPRANDEALAQRKPTAEQPTRPPVRPPAPAKRPQ